MPETSTCPAAQAEPTFTSTVPFCAVIEWMSPARDATMSPVPSCSAPSAFVTDVRSSSCTVQPSVLNDAHESSGNSSKSATEAKAVSVLRGAPIYTPTRFAAAKISLSAYGISSPEIVISQ